MFSSVFLLKPFRPSSLLSCTASMSSSIEPMWSSSYSDMAFFGPSPGIDMSWRTPAGICERSSSTAWMVPVSRNSWILSPMDLPTLGMARIPFASRSFRSAW
jgi:hypothetical protein